MISEIELQDQARQPSFDERSQGERSPPPETGVATTTLLRASVDHDAATTEQMQRLRRASVWGVTCNNIAFMAVPRSVPACFAATGWSAGLACLLFSSIVTYDTGVVLGEVCNAHPALTSFPLLVGEASATNAFRNGRDAERWRKERETFLGSPAPNVPRLHPESSAQATRAAHGLAAGVRRRQSAERPPDPLPPPPRRGARAQPTRKTRVW